MGEGYVMPIELGSTQQHNNMADRVVAVKGLRGGSLSERNLVALITGLPLFSLKHLNPAFALNIATSP